MFDKGLIFGGFNPLHHEHLNLIKTGLIKTKKIDLYAGKKQKPGRLPYEIRVDTLRIAIANEGLKDRVNIIIPENGLFSLDKSDYSVLIAGSDFLNHMSLQKNIFKQKERDFVSYFKNIIMMEIPGDQLTYEAREVLTKSASLIEYEGKMPISSSMIRENYCTGKGIEEMVPAYVKEHIQDYLNIFHQARKKNL